MRNRITLRIFILTLFLSLIVVAFAIVIVFTRSRDTEQVVLSATELAKEIDQVITEKFNNIASGAERLTKITAGQFFSLGNISIENKELQSIMLNISKYDLLFAQSYIGLKDGSFFGVTNLINSGQTHYITDPTKPLPPNIAFSVMYSQSSGASGWRYLNDQFQEITSESVTSPFNPLTRPWYEGALETKKTFWTNFYPFFPTNELGITSSTPVFNKEGEVIAVVGADLTYKQLADFLQSLVIGKTGRAFIVSENQKIVIPNSNEKQSAVTLKLLSDVLSFEKTHPEARNFIFENNETQYLVHISRISVIFGRNLHTVIIAPLDDFFAEVLKKQRNIILLMIGILILSSIFIVYFAHHISSPIVALSNEINKIRYLNLESTTRIKSRIKELFAMDASIDSMRNAIRSFASYVPKEVVKRLFQKGEGITLGGEKKTLTIFFSDIIGFTAIAESLNIDILTRLLTNYFGVMTKIILDSEGTVDKFIGDAVMAFWGAPLDVSKHASKACTSALKCKVAMDILNQKQKSEGYPEFHTRFGIHTGNVIVGNIGTPDRMNYTVIGDAVNVTARLQEIDKVYHTTILISEDVYQLVKDEFLTRPIDHVNVKGKKEKIKIYELMAGIEGTGEIAATKEQIELCALFTEAYETLHKDASKARPLFQAILQKFPDDFPTQFHLEFLKGR